MAFILSFHYLNIPKWKYIMCLIFKVTLKNVMQLIFKLLKNYAFDRHMLLQVTNVTCFSVPLKYDVIDCCPTLSR